MENTGQKTCFLNNRDKSIRVCGVGVRITHTAAFNALGFSVVEKPNLKKYDGHGVGLTQT